MINAFSSHLIKKHQGTRARIMHVHTPHGDVLTPAFMPVGTRAYVNHMTTDDLCNVHSQIILGGNTYHMLCSPGLNVIEQCGGMHGLMAWNKPMLTDSGGFQVFSLSKNKKLCTIDEQGARFKHPITGAVLQLSPAESIRAQKIIGADIMMAFDQCTPDEGGREAAIVAMQRTHQWLEISKITHDKNPYSAYGHRQALFGIIQGGRFDDLRMQCVEQVVNMDLDGIALGGEVIGSDIQKTVDIIRGVEPLLPENKLRYTMGVGLHPQDLIDVVKEGIDIFDCVAPTRNARHGALYQGKIIKKSNWLQFRGDESEQGRMLIKKSQHSTDQRPIMEDCTCSTCLQHSRAYLHFLFKTRSSLYAHLASIHNIHVMHAVCTALREHIMESTA